MLYKERVCTKNGRIKLVHSAWVAICKAKIWEKGSRVGQWDIHTELISDSATRFRMVETYDNTYVRKIN